MEFDIHFRPGSLSLQQVKVTTSSTRRKVSTICLALDKKTLSGNTSDEEQERKGSYRIFWHYRVGNERRMPMELCYLKITIVSTMENSRSTNSKIAIFIPFLDETGDMPNLGESPHHKCKRFPSKQMA